MDVYLIMYENKTKAITLMGATDKTVVEASLSCAMLLNLFLTPVLMGKGFDRSCKSAF